MSKRLMIVAVLVLFVLAGIYFSRFQKAENYDQPVGGWEDLKSKVELQFSENEDIKKAALQVAQVLQEAIDSPNRAKVIVKKMDEADACFEAVSAIYGVKAEDIHLRSQLLEDLAADTTERKKRYIRYNANLSGGVYALIDTDLKYCDFSIVRK